MGFFTQLFGGSESSNSGNKTNNATTSNTTQTDNRVVLGNDATQLGAFSSLNSGNTTRNDTSFQVNDSSQHNTTTIGTDGGSVAIAGFNANLLQAVSENQGDTVRLLSKMGSDGIARQAEAATNLFATSSSTSGAAWGHTIDKSAELIDKLLTTAQGTVAGANAVASQAVSAFEPTANKTSDALKYALIAAGLFVAFKVFKG